MLGFFEPARLHRESTSHDHTTMSTPSSPETPKSHCESITSFECPRVPPFVAYRIRPHQVPLIHKRLQTVIPELGYKDNDAARYVQKSLQRDTQVLFVAQDGHDTPQPHEAIMLSMGKGSRVRVYHASRPVTGEIDWFQWVEATAEGLGLQKIELPFTIFSEDIGWMLRAQSASKWRSDRYIVASAVQFELTARQVREDYKSTSATHT